MNKVEIGQSAVSIYKFIFMSIEELKLNDWKDEKGNYWNNPSLGDWYDYDLYAELKLTMGYKIPGWFINDFSKSYFEVYRYIPEFLKKHNRTLEEYYVRFFLNLPQVPKCKNPNCNNLVHVVDGKLTHGLTDCCSRSCHISVNNFESWTNPDYFGNQDWFRKLKSIEMTENLKIWNHDAEFQALAKRGKILAKGSCDYYFYLARTDKQLKFGVCMAGSENYRLFIQDAYNNDPYLSFHILYIADSAVMADFEYELKSLFNFREYLNWSEFSLLKSSIRTLLPKYKIYKLKFNDYLEREYVESSTEVQGISIKKINEIKI